MDEDPTAPRKFSSKSASGAAGGRGSGAELFCGAQGDPLTMRSDLKPQKIPDLSQTYPTNARSVR